MKRKLIFSIVALSLSLGYLINVNASTNPLTNNYFSKNKIQPNISIPFKVKEDIIIEGTIQEPFENKYDISRIKIKDLSGEIKNIIVNFPEDITILYMKPKNKIHDNPFSFTDIKSITFDPKNGIQNTILKKYFSTYPQINSVDYRVKNNGEDKFIFSIKMIFNNEKIEFLHVRSTPKKELNLNKLRYPILEDNARNIFNTFSQFLGNNLSEDYSVILTDDCSRAVAFEQKKMAVIEFSNSYLISTVKDDIIYQWFISKDSNEIIDYNNIDNEFQETTYINNL